MIPLFLDTSFVIALFNATDPHHEQTKAWHATLLKEQRPKLTTTAILLELGDGFARKGRWDLISPFLAAVVHDPMVQVVPVDTSLLERAREFRNARPDKHWGLTDCVSFVVMDEKGLTEALTADRHFQQAGFRALLLEP
jgi:predicted nucleic acid-binding protein